jgi:glycosyltransferase involved in cell wall biosynthesis
LRIFFEYCRAWLQTGHHFALKTVYFTVTSDLNYDQRMLRICSSLAAAGYKIHLIGCELPTSTPVLPQNFIQKRINCLFSKGKLFYSEYNLRLFFYLLFKKMDAICSIDLDTIMPCYFISQWKRIPRIYDAHEYFSQMKEVISRPGIYKFWHGVEKKYVSRFKNGYTVSQSIAAEFKKLYNVDYAVIQNVPLLKDTIPSIINNKTIIYQGAINEARGLEFLIPAMKNVNAQLHIYGDGNFIVQTKALITANNLQNKVLLKEKLLPAELAIVTASAYIGINLVEHNGLNQYYSLANKFFDYMHSGIPQVTMNYPEYKRINDDYEIAILIDDLKEKTMAAAINNLLDDTNLYDRLKNNCIAAKEKYNWQQEEKKLITFYDKIFTQRR